MKVQLSPYRTALTSVHFITKSGQRVYQKIAGCERFEAASDWCVRWSGTDDGTDHWRSRLHPYIRTTRGHSEYSPWHKL